MTLAVPSKRIQTGATLYIWSIYKLHCSLVIFWYQNWTRTSMSSSFVLGSTIATCRFIWFHTISMESRYGLSDGHTSYQLMLLSLIKSLAIFDRCFGSLSCWNLWPSGNFTWMYVRRLSRRMQLVKNSFSMMSSNIVSLDASLLLMAPQTWTLSGRFGFPKTIGAESLSR